MQGTVSLADCPKEFKQLTPLVRGLPLSTLPQATNNLQVLRHGCLWLFFSLILTLAFTFSISLVETISQVRIIAFPVSLLPFCFFLDPFSLSNLSPVNLTHFSLLFYSPFNCPCLYYPISLPLLQLVPCFPLRISLSILKTNYHHVVSFLINLSFKVETPFP